MSQNEIDMFLVNLIEDQIRIVKLLEDKYPGLLVKLGTTNCSDKELSEEFGLSQRRVRRIRVKFGANILQKLNDAEMKVGGVYVVKKDFVDTWNRAESPQMVADHFGISRSSSSNPRAALCSAATILRKKGFTLKRFGRGRPKLRKEA